MKRAVLAVMTAMVMVLAMVLAAPRSASAADSTGGPARVPDKLIALSFDDGPSPLTPRLLGVLTRHQVPATFFVQGSHVLQYVGLTRTIMRRGHVIGGHSFSHPDFAQLTPAQAGEEIDRTTAAIKLATGLSPTLFRFPFGNSTAAMESLVRQRGMTSALWHWPTALPGDFECPGAEGVRQYVLANAADQAVLLLHDGNEVEECGASQLNYLNKVIPELKALGYRFGVIQASTTPSAVNDGSYIKVVPAA